jgi:hypothetical protein
MMSQLPKIPFLTAVMLLIVIVSCQDRPQFEDTPYLEWRDAEYERDPVNGTSVVNMKLYFTDGDGDVGRKNEGSIYDCETQYEQFIADHDVFIRYYEKVSGTFIRVLSRDSCLPFHSYLPYLTPEGQNKTLEGEIELRFNSSGLPSNAGVDSVRFELELEDRAGNRSNVVFSPSISIQQ